MLKKELAVSSYRLSAYFVARTTIMLVRPTSISSPLGIATGRWLSVCARLPSPPGPLPLCCALTHCVLRSSQPLDFIWTVVYCPIAYYMGRINDDVGSAAAPANPEHTGAIACCVVFGVDTDRGALLASGVVGVQLSFWSSRRST